MRRHCLILTALVLGQGVSAAEFGGYAALTTDYVKRGVTQSDGNPALQLGGDVSFANGFFLGAWGSTTDINNGPGRQRDHEVNYYFGYAADVTKSWRLSANTVAYVYPGQSGSINYNYREYSISGNYDDRLWLEFSYSPDLYHTGASSTNVDLFAEWPLNSVWSIGAGAGRYDTSNLTGSAYQYWQLGITASFKWADVDLRIHDTDRSVPIISTPDRANARLVLKIQLPF